jgi:hypothetical protein
MLFVPSRSLLQSGAIATLFFSGKISMRTGETCIRSEPLGSCSGFFMMWRASSEFDSPLVIRVLGRRADIYPC